MLSFERHLVTSLVENAEPARRDAVVSYVDGALAELPDFIRLGVLAESVAFSGWAATRRIVTRRADTADELLDRLERNPIGLVRQYPRLLRSLTLFAEQEGVDEPVPTDREVPAT